MATLLKLPGYSQSYSLRPDNITVTDSGTYYTFHQVKAKELLKRATLYAYNDSLHVDRSAMVDSLTIRAVKADSIIHTFYLRLEDKNGELKACEQLISISETEKEVQKAEWKEKEGVFNFEIATLQKKIRWKSIENWVWRVLAVFTAYKVITK